MLKALSVCVVMLLANSAQAQVAVSEEAFRNYLAVGDTFVAMRNGNAVARVEFRLDGTYLERYDNVQGTFCVRGHWVWQDNQIWLDVYELHLVSQVAKYNDWRLKVVESYLDHIPMVPNFSDDNIRFTVGVSPARPDPSISSWSYEAQTKADLDCVTDS